MKTIKKQSILFGLLMLMFGISNSNAQIRLGDKALGSIKKGITGFTFSDADAALLSKEVVNKLDSENIVGGAKDPYAIRLARVFGKYTAGDGFTLNFKVYKLNEVNAFATADGSVRVYSGLMDIMDDNELLAVIGHEIGHVANHDSKDAMKAAYKKEALMDAVASQSNAVSALSGSQLGVIGNALIDSKHSRKQESAADLYSYNFLKKNGCNVNAEESAFRILVKMSAGAQSSFFTKMMSSHPASIDRADIAKARAEKDGLYKLYVQEKIVNTLPVAAKAKGKKAVKKKK